MTEEVKKVAESNYNASNIQVLEDPFPREAPSLPLQVYPHRDNSALPLLASITASSVFFLSSTLW